MCVINGLAIQDSELTAVAAELGFRVTDGTTWSERLPHPEPIEPTAVTDTRWRPSGWENATLGRAGTP